jgi:hypothetical protein
MLTLRQTKPSLFTKGATFGSAGVDRQLQQDSNPVQDQHTIQDGRAIPDVSKIPEAGSTTTIEPTSTPETVDYLKACKDAKFNVIYDLSKNHAKYSLASTQVGLDPSKEITYNAPFCNYPLYVYNPDNTTWEINDMQILYTAIEGYYKTQPV